MNMAAIAKIVCSNSVFSAWYSLWDFCDLTQSNNSINELDSEWLDYGMDCCKNKSVHCTPWTVDLLSSIRNGTGVMAHKPLYSFKRLVNVYKVRLNVYKIKR